MKVFLVRIVKKKKEKNNPKNINSLCRPQMIDHFKALVAVPMLSKGFILTPQVGCWQHSPCSCFLFPELFILGKFPHLTWDSWHLLQ